MNNNPYRDYYKAKSRNDEWSDVDAAEAKKESKNWEVPNHGLAKGRTFTKNIILVVVFDGRKLQHKTLKYD